MSREWSGPSLEDPPGYDPADKYKDPVLYFKHREAAVAQKYLEVSEAKVGVRGGEN